MKLLLPVEKMYVKGNLNILRRISDNMMRAVEFVVLEIFEKVIFLITSIFHFTFWLFYFSRGRKVPSIRDPILMMSATELAEQIREGKLTSECVVTAFIDRIMTVDPLICATVDRRFRDALQEAREVDALVASGIMSTMQLAKEKPLLGVPFTVKLLLTVKGLRSTAGSPLLKDVRAEEDAETVAQMRKAGAIVLATTNIPEYGMNFETYNYVHGTTCNPYDTSKTPGGSSGGEAALLAAAGSVIGLGNDLGGSIRIPAMFCGIFGHKATRGLISNHGCFLPPSKEAMHLVYSGPMCRYATDLVTMMKILASEKNDMFGREVNFGDLKVYYMLSFGYMRCANQVDPDIKKCIQKVISYFETQHGSQVKEANIPLFDQSINIHGHALFTAMPNIAEFVSAGKTEIHPIQELIKFIFRESQFSLATIASINVFNIPFLYNKNLVEHYEKLGEQLDKELSNLLDDRSVLILPTLPFAAPYHREIALLIGSVGYASIFNVLGNPVTQCPIGFNRKGLPIGVQIVGRRGNDHLAIACAAELEKAFGGWIPPTSEV